MKKEYISPEVKQFVVEGCQLLDQTQFDPDKDQQDVTPVTEEYGGGFGANRFSVWDEE